MANCRRLIKFLIRVVHVYFIALRNLCMCIYLPGCRNRKKYTVIGIAYRNAGVYGEAGSAGRMGWIREALRVCLVESSRLSADRRGPAELGESKGQPRGELDWIE